jgi:hypothetical protein
VPLKGTVAVNLHSSPKIRERVPDGPIPPGGRGIQCKALKVGAFDPHD